MDVAPELLQPWADARVHALNHKPRRSLSGKTPCEVFFAGKSAVRSYDRRRRREVYNEIVETTLRIVENLDPECDLTRTTAWRVSVENWLRKNGAISVSSYGKVSPDFQRVRYQK